MAQAGSSVAARSNDRIASGWLNAQHRVRPWSKYRWASSDDVVTLWWRLPRLASSGALPLAGSCWAAATAAVRATTTRERRANTDVPPAQQGDSIVIRRGRRGGQGAGGELRSEE